MKHPTKTMIVKVCLVLLAAVVFTGGEHIGVVQEDELLMANLDAISQEYGTCDILYGLCIDPKPRLEGGL